MLNTLIEWFGNRCRRRGLLAHRAMLHLEDGRLRLRCADCGRKSPGWDVTAKVQRSACAWPRPGRPVPMIYAGQYVIGGDTWDVMVRGDAEPQDDDVPVGLDHPDAASLTVLDAALLYEFWARNRNLLQ